LEVCLQSSMVGSEKARWAIVQLNVALHKAGAAPSPVQRIAIPGIVLCGPIGFVQSAV
jgi:hypothetical protein